MTWHKKMLKLSIKDVNKQLTTAFLTKDPGREFTPSPVKLSLYNSTYQSGTSPRRDRCKETRCVTRCDCV